MNIGFFGGRLGRDAELKRLERGEIVANFPLAVSTGTKTDPETMWIDCSIWGKRAESLAPYLLSGQKVTVSGRILLETYTKKSGDAGYRLNCNVNDLDLHGGSSQINQAAAGGSALTKPAAAPGIDDDVPF